MRLSTLLVASCMLLFSACNKVENMPQPDLGLDYFPLKIEAVVIYNVDSTVYNDFTNTVVTHQFLLKDSVTNQFIDGQGDEAYRIERYKKTNTLDWTFQKIITRKIINNRAEEVMDNRRFVRLVFPLTAQSVWNGNLYNDLEEWPHRVMAINEVKDIDNLHFNSTVTVEQYNEVNLLHENIYTETYAKGVGLVLKEVKAIEKYFGTEQIRKGHHTTYRIESYQ